jgi:preprotein translocase subunit SecA
LLQHYLLMVPAFEEGGEPPASVADAVAEGLETAGAAFAAKFDSLNASVTPEDGRPATIAGTVLSHVMLGVLDEKWKDHLYDLDQLRNSINYRAWGQKDPLIEYKQEAYTMFVDLMHDIYSTFTERFLRAQIVFGGFGPPGGPPSGGPPRDSGSGPTNGRGPQAGAGPTRRFNALGVLEDIPSEEVEPAVMDVGPSEPPGSKPVERSEPKLVGAGGRARSLSAAPAGPTPPVAWSTVGRNDPCPCGSGKKYKKCHGATG